MSQDIDETVKQEMLNLQESLGKQQSDSTVVADELTKLREKLELTEANMKEETQKIIEKQNELDRPATRQGSPMKFMSKIQNVAGLGQQ